MMWDHRRSESDLTVTKTVRSWARSYLTGRGSKDRVYITLLTHSQLLYYYFVQIHSGKLDEIDVVD